MANSFTSTTAAGGRSARQMVDLITSALAANPVGVVSITVDGQVVTWSRAQALEELKFWQRQAAKEAGTRPRAARIVLGW